MANLLVSDHSLFRTNRKSGSGEGYQFESIEIYKIARICGANIPGRRKSRKGATFPIQAFAELKVSSGKLKSSVEFLENSKSCEVPSLLRRRSCGKQLMLLLGPPKVSL